jgi:ferritin-like metal-binding protein YciE
MATIENLRNGLIDKILSIQNKDFLEALDTIISNDSEKAKEKILTPEQKIMLEMSEDDIINGRLISQEAIEKRNLEWLNEK